MELGPGEPAAGPWRVVSLDDFGREVAGAARRRPRLIAVDGRGGSGKTALAGRLGRVLGPAAIVHSDDVAWGHSRFGWDDLMADGVIGPLRAGRAVRYRPPGWDNDQPPHWAERGRLEVEPAETVIIEGVGVGRRSLAPLVDVVVWVQSDYAEARRRGIARDIAELGRSHDDAVRNWDEWDAEEVVFLAGDRPWERAGFVVGTDGLPHDAEAEVVVTTRPRAGSAG